MFEKKIYEYLDNKNHYTVDKFVLRCSKELNLNANSLILLIYLLNQKNKDIFDYKKILDDLNFNETELLESISVLKEKKILSIIMEKNESGILEEHIDISSFYNIMLSRILDEEKNETNKQNIYDSFEKEFGRTLSPMEYEIINNWLEQKISEELIIEALKEAVFNGANNLRYIDKILFEWNKKGIKKTSDINKNQKEIEEEKQEECYEYDWLNE